MLNKISRKKIVTESKNFPTIIEGVTKQLDKGRNTYVDDREDSSVLTHINYKNGKMLNISEIRTSSSNAHYPAHSAGAVPLELDKWNVDFAVGCSYKYLNGGPGAPGYLYVADRHIGKYNQPLTGWFAHKSPFAFKPQYEPR